VALLPGVRLPTLRWQRWRAHRFWGRPNSKSAGLQPPSGTSSANLAPHSCWGPQPGRAGNLGAAGARLVRPLGLGRGGHIRFHGDSAPDTGTQLRLNPQCAFTKAESATRGDSGSPEDTFSPRDADPPVSVARSTQVGPEKPGLQPNHPLDAAFGLLPRKGPVRRPGPLDFVEPSYIMPPMPPIPPMP
jgi:hypothetical protein